MVQAWGMDGRFSDQDFLNVMANFADFSLVIPGLPRYSYSSSLCILVPPLSITPDYQSSVSYTVLTTVNIFGTSTISRNHM